MVKRNWCPPEAEKAFFEVSKVPLYFKTPEGKERRAKNYYGICDTANGKILSAVSNGYKIVSNLDAFLGAEMIVREVFRDIRLKNMQFFNLYLPWTRSFMRLDLVCPGTKISPFENDPWTAFLRITNSYNRLYALSYEIGFCRWICQNGMIYGSKSIKVSFDHCDRIDLDAGHIRARLGQIRDIESEFSLRLHEMRDFPIPRESVPEIFFSVFPMQTGKDPGALSSIRQERICRRKQQIQQLAESYTAEMGCNAYAMLNILTDFATFPEPGSGRGNPLSGFYQKRIGKWMDEFGSKVIKGGMSLHKFIPPEARETAEMVMKAGS